MLCLVLLLAVGSRAQFPLHGGLKNLRLFVQLPPNNTESIVVETENGEGDVPLLLHVDFERNITEGASGIDSSGPWESWESDEVGGSGSSGEAVISADLPAKALQYNFLTLEIKEDDTGFNVSQMQEAVSLRIPKDEGGEPATSLGLHGPYATSLAASFGEPMDIADEDFAVAPVPFRSHNQLQLTGKLHNSSDGSLTIYSVPADESWDFYGEAFDAEDYEGDIPLRIVARAGAAAFELSARKDGAWTNLPAPGVWAWQDNTAVPLKAGESFKVDMLFRTPSQFFSGRGIRLWVFGPSEDAYNRNMFGFSFADVPGLNATEQRIILKADADVDFYNLARTA